MEILFLLIPVSLVLLGLAIWAFFWAVKSGQFDDLESPAYRILMDEDRDTERGTDDAPGHDAEPRDDNGANEEPEQGSSEPRER